MKEFLMKWPFFLLLALAPLLAVPRPAAACPS
jgi:hypothetical protein